MSLKTSRVLGAVHNLYWGVLGGAPGDKGEVSCGIGLPSQLHHDRQRLLCFQDESFKVSRLLETPPGVLGGRGDWIRGVCVLHEEAVPCVVGSHLYTTVIRIGTGWPRMGVEVDRLGNR